MWVTLKKLEGLMRLREEQDTAGPGDPGAMRLTGHYLNFPLMLSKQGWITPLVAVELQSLQTDGSC